MPTSLTDDLKRDIAEGRVTVVVGAGVSMAAAYDPARKPNVAAWTGLLESGADECAKVAQPLPKGWEERVRGEIASGEIGSREDQPQARRARRPPRGSTRI